MLSGITGILSTIGSVLGVNSIADAVDKINKNDLSADQEMQLQIELAKIGVQSQSLTNEDMVNLRENNTNINNHLNFTIANVSAIIVSLILIICGACLNGMLEEIRGMLVATGTGILGLYYGYWLGSSQGSLLKNGWRANNQ